MITIKKEVRKKGYPLMALAKASGINQTRLSNLLNLWIEPKPHDIDKLKLGLEKLKINPDLASTLQEQFKLSKTISEYKPQPF